MNYCNIVALIVNACFCIQNLINSISRLLRNTLLILKGLLLLVGSHLAFVQLMLIGVGGEASDL